MYQKGMARKCLDQLETLIMAERITPTKRVDFETFICFTEATPQGQNYHQCELHILPDELKPHFYGKTLGDSFGRFKIIGIFDVWPEKPIKHVMPVDH